jgi:hypothetical protein
MLVEHLSLLGVTIDCEHIRYGSRDISLVSRDASALKEYDFVVNCVNKYEVNPAFGDSQICITACEATTASNKVLSVADSTLEFWVPSAHSRVGLLNAGVSRSVFVLPLGVTPEVVCVNRVAAGSPFTFLVVATWEWRKCPDLILKAFGDEFRDDYDVQLIVKTRNIKSEIAWPSELPRNVKIIDAFLPRTELYDLYRTCHAYVGVTRDWSAPVEYLDSSLNLFVDVDRFVQRPASIDPECLTYCEPSYASLRQQMRKMRSDYDAQYAKMLLQREKLIERYSWLKSSEVALARLRRLRSARDTFAGGERRE